MTRDEIQKLLGGYATGTLTPAEQEALFAAALEDQEIFDALGREQALRDLLRDPAAKTELLAALDEPQPARWWNWRPVAAVLAMAGIGAVAVVIVRQNQSKPQPTLVARVEPAQVAEPPAEVKVEAAPPVAATAAPQERRARKDFVPPAPSPVAAPPAPPVEVVPPVVEQFARAKDLPVIGGVPGGFGGRGGRGLPQAINEQAARALFFSPRQQNFLSDSTADKVEITAAAPASQLQQQGGPSQSRSQSQPAPAPQFRAASNMAASKVAEPSPASLGVRYVILRREANGDFTQVQPEELKTGDTLQLRFTTNANGYIRVHAQQPDGTDNIIGSNYMNAMAPYTTGILHGETKVSVAFARDEQGTLQAPRIDLIQTGATRTDPASYVVNPAGGGVVFTITLKYQ